MKFEWKKAAIYTAGTITGAALAISTQSFASSQKDALPVQDIRTFAEVYHQIKANYYKETKDEELIKNALKGMVSGLDPHSEFMDPKDFKDMKESTSGEFGGLGMEIGKKQDSIVVIAPIEDTPAFNAGVKSGDFIVKINDESTRGMTTTEAVKKMRGKPGTEITLTLTRKDRTTPIVVHMKRAMIKVKSVRSKLIEKDYGYIRLMQFQERSTADLVKHIKDLYKQNGAPLKGLVLDLRDNPGGLLTQSVGVSAVFLPANSTVVSTKGRDGRGGTSYKATRNDYQPANKGIADPLSGLPNNIKDIPITVLINSGSASASEIVTGALQDHKRAVVVGVQSFGKGSVQTVMPLSNSAAVKLTIALYYTPNDRSIQAQGIVPDLEIKNEDDVFAIREADLGGHLDNPKGGDEVKGKVDEEAAKNKQEKKAKKTDDERFDEMMAKREPNPDKDVQLKTALDLLKNPDEYSKNIGLAAKEGRDKKEIKKDGDE